MSMTVRRQLSFLARLPLPFLFWPVAPVTRRAKPASPFSEALARNYTDLANQAAAVPAPESDEGFMDSTADFFTNPFGLFGDSGNSDSVNELLVKAFSTKADLAAQGEEPAPEPAPPDQTAQTLHDRLVRAVEAGKDKFPEQSARAQADYDCWVLDAGVAGMGAAAQACKTSLDGSLLALENAARPAAPPPTFPVAPVAPIAPPPPPAAAPTDYTVYFDLDSWTLDRRRPDGADQCDQHRPPRRPIAHHRGRPYRYQWSSALQPAPVGTPGQCGGGGPGGLGRTASVDPGFGRW